MSTARGIIGRSRGRTGACAACRASGFSLIELMIAVAVLAIIAAVAIPSYSAYVVRGQRAAAKGVLLQMAQAMERNYTTVGIYGLSAANPTGLPNALQPITGAPACIAVSPSDSSVATYCVGVNVGAGGASFKLTATPCGDGAGTCPAGSNAGFVDAQCDVLTLDNAGVKGALNGTATTAVATGCWSQ